MKNIEGTPGLEWTVYKEENQGWKSEAGGRGSGDGLKEETLEGKEGGGWSCECGGRGKSLEVGAGALSGNNGI